MANIDKVSVKNTVYNIVSPAVVSDYIEVIGGACTKPDGYEEDEVILAKQNDVQLLFKATQDIAFGANIVENTNCVRTTLEEVLKNAGGGGGASSADQVSYDNSDSGLEAENVQEAVDELATNAGTASSQIQTLTNQVTALLDNTEVNGAVNMLPNNATTQVINGITFTVNDDGSVTANGTATENTILYVDSSTRASYKDGAYKLSGCPSGGSTSTYCLRINPNTGSNIYDIGDGTLATITSSNPIRFEIVIFNGTTVSNLTFKPMLTVPSYNGDYVPYAKSNKELTKDNNDLNTKMSYINPINVTMNVYMTSDAIPSWGNFTTQDATDIAQAMYDVYKKIGGKQGNYFGNITLIWCKKSDGTILGAESDLCEIIMSGASYNTCLADNTKTRMRFNLKPYGHCVTTDFALWGSSFNYLRQGTDTSGTVVNYHQKETVGTISTYVG